MKGKAWKSEAGGARWVHPAGIVVDLVRDDDGNLVSATIEDAGGSVRTINRPADVDAWGMGNICRAEGLPI